MLLSPIKQLTETNFLLDFTKKLNTFLPLFEFFESFALG